MINWLKEKQAGQLYNSFLIILTGSALSFAINHVFKLQINLILILFLCSALTVIIFILVSNSNKFLIGAVAGVTLIAAIMVGKLFSIRTLERICEMYNWFILYQQEEAEYIFGFALTIVIAASVIGCILFYFIGRGIVSRAAATVLIAVFFVWATVKGVELPKISIAFYFVYAGSFLIELSHRRYSQNKGGKYEYAGVFLFPIIMLLCLIILFLPSREKPIQWTLIRQFAAGITEKIEDISYRLSIEGRGDGLYTLNMTGFSGGDNELGGDINPDEKAVLKIEQNGKTKGKIYLTGSVKSNYTGRKWTNDQIEETEEEELFYTDLYEKLYYLYHNKIEGTVDLDFLNYYYLTVSFEDIRTKSVLYPINMSFIGKSTAEQLTFSDGNLTFLNTRKNGTEYNVSVVEYNRSHPKLISYLRGENNGDVSGSFETAEETLLIKENDLFRFNKNYIQNNLSTILKNRENEIKEKYLSLPADTPERLYELTEEITKGCKSDYDKLLAIQQYLLQFEYSTNPGKLPEGRDFVDYFIYEKQNGYCTYFASSMAVLSRCAGIPSRYVEGFVFQPPTNKTSYYVYSNNAHAWAEMYLNGFGWIQIEATPGYMESGGKREDWRKEISSNTAIMSDDQISYIPDTPLPDPIPEIPVMVQEPNRHIGIGLLFIGIFFILIILLVIILIYRFTGERKQYHNADTREKIILDMKEILFYLELMRYRFKPDETVTSMKKAVEGFEKESGVSLSDSFDIFIKARYSYMDMEEQEANIVRENLSNLKTYLYAREKVTKKWYYKLNWILKNG